MTVKCVLYLEVGVVLKRLVPKTPYLVHDYSKTPHITGCGVFVVVESLERKHKSAAVVPVFCYICKRIIIHNYIYYIIIPPGLSI